MTVTGRIEINGGVMLGKPVIRGTRIPVELILRKLGDGASEADLLDAYPSLTRDDIRPAMRYAADTLAYEEVVFTPGWNSSECLRRTLARERARLIRNVRQPESPTL